YAGAAAAVARAGAHGAAACGLAGEQAWDSAGLAATIGGILGREVTYQALTQAEQVKALRAAGLDETSAGFVAALDAGIAAGALDTDDRTLSRLIGRPTTPLAQTLRSLA